MLCKFQHWGVLSLIYTYYVVGHEPVVLAVGMGCEYLVGGGGLIFSILSSFLARHDLTTTKIDNHYLQCCVKLHGIHVPPYFHSIKNAFC